MVLVLVVLFLVLPFAELAVIVQAADSIGLGWTLLALVAVSIAGGKEAAPVSSLHKCMACGTGLSRRPSKKKGQFWWGCANFPTCKQTYPDLKGRPDYSKGRNGPAAE